MAVLAALLSLLPGVAAAAPANPSDGDIASAQADQQAAAAEVGRLAGAVATAQADLDRVETQTEAASDAYRTAQGRLDQAQALAREAASRLQAATVSVEAARTNVAALGRQAYIGHETLNGAMAMLNAAGPSALMQEAATLQVLGQKRANTLAQLRAAEAQQASADAQARAAVAEQDRAVATAAQAKTTAEAQQATFQAALQTVSAQKTGYDQQLQAAQVRLLALQGQRDAYQAWQQQQAAQAAAANAQAAAAAQAAAEQAARARQGGSGGVAPTSGVFTTCFEMRWGEMHWGIDIAAPIGTPIYAPIAGTVIRVGPATGFGLAVYIQHADGDVTVYGHINSYSVSVGQRVSAGQQIAEVGNRGESTGPHLHFEVATDGPYAGRIDPIPWLAGYGVSMGGRCT